MSESFSNAVASGTQDLAALAGLFCTNSVEQSALATNSGYGKVIVSALSMLGLLGLVKSTLKITLGAAQCAAAGFSLDSVRGIFGYSAEEQAVAGTVIDCSLVKVVMTESIVSIRKEARRFDSRRTPMVQVGSKWPEKLEFKTVVNLGNLAHESSFLQSLWIIIPFAILVTGSTTWLILVIKYPWTWVKYYATCVLHVMIFLMLTVPLWFSRKTEQPGRHLTRQSWNMIASSDVVAGSVSFLQARVNHGNVIHFQGDISLINSLVGRGAAFLVALATAVGYLCQYAIVKAATDRQAIIWISGQTFLALLRALYWISDPSFDDPNTHRAEFAMINNSCFDTLTLVELVCGCRDGQTDIPIWVWNYLKQQNFRQLLCDANDQTDEQVPTDAETFLGYNIDFDYIIQGRAGLQGSFQGYSEVWQLAFWKKGDKVQPFFLVHAPFRPMHGITDGNCWIQASFGNSSHTSNTGVTQSMCSMFAATPETGRIHVRSASSPLKCDENCPNPVQAGDVTSVEGNNTRQFLGDRMRIRQHLRRLTTYGPEGQNQLERRRNVNTWGFSVWTSATEGTTDSDGRLHKLSGDSENGTKAQPIDVAWLGRYIDRRSSHHWAQKWFQSSLKRKREKREEVSALESGTKTSLGEQLRN